MSIRPLQETIEKPGRGLVVPELDHVHDSCAHARVGELDRDACLSDALHSVGQHDRRDQQRLLLVLCFDDELLHLRWLLQVQLQARRTECLPLRMLLLQEHLALHLRSDRGHNRARMLRGWRRRRRAHVVWVYGWTRAWTRARRRHNPRVQGRWQQHPRLRRMQRTV